MRLRARGGARRSGSRRVFRAGVWGVSWFRSRFWVRVRGWFPVVRWCRRCRHPGGARWSGSPWPLGLAGGGCGPRRGRSRRRWSWSGSRRSPPRRPSLALGRAGSASRSPFAALLARRVRSGASRCRWPCRHLSGCRFLRRCLRPLGFLAVRVAVPLAALAGGAAALPPPLAGAACRLQRQFSHRQFKPLPGCRFRRDEIHQQRVIVRHGRFGFRPFVCPPTRIEPHQGGLPLRLSGL